MTWTNKYGLPKKIVDLVTQDDYVYRDKRYSVTEILNSTKEIILRRRYRDKVVVDVSDNINKLFGTAFHSLFEDDSENSEIRVETEVNGITLSGRIDHYKGGVITDYKTTTAYKVKHGDFSDWEQQGLLYAYIMFKNGIIVNRVRIMAFIKDFSLSAKQREANYPESHIYIHEFDVRAYMINDIGDFVENKLNELESHKHTPNNELPQPSDDELWYSGTKYRVMKNGLKRAVRVFDNEADANDLLATDSNYYLEVEHGVYRKLEYDNALRQLFMLGDMLVYGKEEIQVWVRAWCGRV